MATRKVSYWEEREPINRWDEEAGLGEYYTELVTDGIRPAFKNDTQFVLDELCALRAEVMRITAAVEQLATLAQYVVKTRYDMTPSYLTAAREEALVRYERETQIVETPATKEKKANA